MHGVWHWLLYLLTWWSADPANLEHERARAAGAVAVAYAALAQEPAPRPRREPEPPQAAPACKECNGTGRIYRPDGGFVRCGCQPCKSGSCPAKR